MNEEKETQTSHLVILLDALLCILAFLGALRIRDAIYGADPLEYAPHIALLPLLLVAILFHLHHFGSYRNIRIATFSSQLWIIAKALFASLVILFIFIFLFQAHYVSRAVILLFAGLSFVALVGVRVLVHWLSRRKGRQGAIRLLVIGTGSRARRFVAEIRRHAEWDIDIVGYLDSNPDKLGTLIMGARVIGTVDEIGTILEGNVIDEVVMAVPRSIIKDVEAIALACEEQGVKFRFMADVFDLQVPRMRLVKLGSIPLLTFEPVAQDEVKLLVKRLIDIAACLALMPVALPLMLLIAIAIKLDSPGPVLFVQKRVGYRKRIFPMLKFRSMVQGSEQRQKELETMNEAAGPIFKIKNDPRITRVGRILRKTSLDELPQLFNVLRGDMSLVGPRPMSLRDVNMFDKGIQRKRFSVRPGLTCLWQVSGRSNLTFDDWLRLDLEYIERWTLGLDLQILLKTIPAVLYGRGAV